MQTFNQHFEQRAQQLIQRVNKLKNRSKRQFFLRATILTIYGFQVAIPVLICLAVGILLDKTWPTVRFSWVLNGILLGFLIGLYNANAWFYDNISIKQDKGDRK